MATHYKETPWWWYGLVLLGSFILGLIVVLKENITVPAWAYIVSLVVGTLISPFVSTSLLSYQGDSADLDCYLRALSFMPVMAMALLPTTCPR